MYRRGIAPKHALDMVQQARAEAEPNEGFMQQLEDYHGMLTAAGSHTEQASGGSEAQA